MKKTEDCKRLKAMKKSELISEVLKFKKEEALFSLKVKAGKEVNNARISALRKNIARALTVLNMSGE